MPREKGRPGHAVIRVDSDVGKKHKKIADLIPVVEHLRRCLDNHPDYFGLSDHLDDSVDHVVNDILESQVGTSARISLMFRTVLESSVLPGEDSIHLYSMPVEEAPKMREIHLGKDLVCVVDESDFDRVQGHVWMPPFTPGQQVHRRFRKDGKTIRQSLADFLMSPPDGQTVEHVNGDKLDHRRENLRLVPVASIRP